MRRRVPIGCGIAGAIAGVVLALPGGGEAAPGELAVQRAILRQGTITLVIRNGSDEPATLAQVSIDSGFADFSGPRGAVAPGTTTTLAVPYPWIAGQGYSVKVLTGGGDALEYRIDG
jgi:hypothetical protein